MELAQQVAIRNADGIRFIKKQINKLNLYKNSKSKPQIISYI